MMPEQEENPVVESTDEEEVTVQKVENGSAPAESADVPTTPAEAKPETEVNVQSGGEITESVGSQEVVAADAAATVLETTQDTPTTTETNAQSAEEWNASFQRVYEKSLQAKEEGTAFYKAQQFMSAKVKYAEAMASAQVSCTFLALLLRLLATNSNACFLQSNRIKAETSPMSNEL
jgi:hypothetical protein